MILDPDYARLIADACNLTVSVKNVQGELNWSKKPHGRMAISLHFPGADRRWVDISIMPCRCAPA